MKINLDTKLRRIALLVLLLAFLGTLAFIFVNSAMPPEKTVEISDAVGSAVGNIVKPETAVGGFVKIHLRKIAHFTEYGLLGIEIALFVLCFIRDIAGKIKLGISFAFLSFAVGFIDESIQVLSGRNASILDVWIDAGGYATFYALTLLVGVLTHLITRKVNNGK